MKIEKQIMKKIWKQSIEIKSIPTLHFYCLWYGKAALFHFSATLSDPTMIYKHIK